MNTARIAILLDNRTAESRWSVGINVFESYIGEVLAHAGIPFDWVHEMHHALESFYDAVIVAAAPNTEQAIDMLWRYAERGGIVVSFAGLGAMARRLGYAKAEPIVKGYAELEGGDRPLRFLQAVPWRLEKQTDHVCREWGTVAAIPGGQPLGAAVQQFPVGNGMIERWAIDVPGAIVGLQQGTAPVSEDGTPAPDGTGAVNDGILKAEDGLEMDWTHDRLMTESGTPYFAFPYADLWREAIVSRLLRHMADKRKAMPFTDYWPEGVNRVAVVSHDSDRNFDEDAVTTMETLAECGIRSSWCMMKPGYSAWVYPRVLEAGHELALHFNSNVNEGGKWEEADFVRQYEWHRAAIGTKLTSNKNHFTRFEGWGDLFRWCEQCGVESDQTRGPSKRGTAGFLFGTCQPYFPIALSNERNRLYNVLEIGFLTQDLPSFTTLEVVEPFLQEAAAVRGVAHFLFHQGRIHSVPEVREALKSVAAEAKRRGFVFWTGGEVNDWVRLRRQVEIVGMNEDGDVIVKQPEGGENAVVWRPLFAGEEPRPDDTVETRFGVACVKMRKKVRLC